MPINPQKSREAHSQIGQHAQAAVSLSPQPDSLNCCDLRGPPAGVVCRDGDASQPIRSLVGRGIHITIEPAPDWATIGLWCICAIAVALFLFALNDPASGMLP